MNKRGKSATFVTPLNKKNNCNLLFLYNLRRKNSKKYSKITISIDLIILIKYNKYISTKGENMFKLCKTEESSKRQREIEQILLNLMLKKHYDEISVSEICVAAAIPRKTLYRYFDGKEGVREALLCHTMTDFSVG